MEQIYLPSKSWCVCDKKKFTLFVAVLAVLLGSLSTSYVLYVVIKKASRSKQWNDSSGLQYGDKRHGSPIPTSQKTHRLTPECESFSFRANLYRCSALSYERGKCSSLL